MFKIKRIIAAVTAAVSIICLSGCGKNESSSDGTAKSSGSTKKIVCTIFPEYDWLRQIIGDNKGSIELTCLMENGTDLHSYQPTAEDLMKISTCDMLVYVGGESDGWVEDAIKNATNKNMKTVNLMEVIGDAAKEEEIKEGMEAEEEEEEEEGPEYDEHVWLSLRHAKTLCSKLTDELCVLDADRADSYKANFSAYSAKLDELDNDIKTLVSGAKNKTLIFGDRFPFRYFVDDYGLDYYAAFVGCSAESEASFKTVTFLAEKLNSIKPGAIYTIESSDGKIAKSIIDSSSQKDCKVSVLNSLQSVTRAQIDEGATYLGLMRQNYETLKADLN